jgi:hypothetical protein
MESLQAKRRLVHELEKRSWIRLATTFLNGSLTSRITPLRTSLDWRPPLQVLTSQTVDISICYALFWDVVYVTRHKDSQ